MIIITCGNTEYVCHEKHLEYTIKCASKEQGKSRMALRIVDAGGDSELLPAMVNRFWHEGRIKNEPTGRVINREDQVQLLERAHAMINSMHDYQAMDTQSAMAEQSLDALIKKIRSDWM